MAEVKMMALFCQGCHEIFSIPSRRGRPPRFCGKCGSDPDTVHAVESAKEEEIADKRLAMAKARVDNLEMMLRSRGTHLQQHRDKYA